MSKGQDTSPAIPEWDALNIPIDNDAEPDDADISHDQENN